MLLFDQNISHRIVTSLQESFPNCKQVRELGLENSPDMKIWEFAKENNLTIVTFDMDFYNISTLKGYPPKIIWLRIGNTSTLNIQNILINKKETILEFVSSEIGCIEII